MDNNETLSLSYDELFSITEAAIDSCKTKNPGPHNALIRHACAERLLQLWVDLTTRYSFTHKAKFEEEQKRLQAMVNAYKAVKGGSCD